MDGAPTDGGARTDEAATVARESSRRRHDPLISLLSVHVSRSRVVPARSFLLLPSPRPDSERADAPGASGQMDAGPEARAPLGRPRARARAPHCSPGRTGPTGRSAPHATPRSTPYRARGGWEVGLVIAVAGARRRRCDFGGGSDDATNEHRDARKSRDERGDVQVARASRGCPSSDGGVVVRCSRSAQPRQAGALRGTKLLRRLDQDQQILW